MPLKTILNIVGGKMGMNPNIQSERNVLLRFVNEAALELYSQSDMAGTLVEQVFKVNGDQTISLPNYVGQLRAVREVNSYIPCHINQLRPRYNVSNWKDMWRNWRIKGQQCLKKSVTNEGPLVISASEVEVPNIVITIAGPTVVASSITEQVTLSAAAVQTINDFQDVTLAVKDRVNNFDILLSDIDGNELTIIPNNMLEASYLIVDVSTLPWASVASAKQDHYVEILYKKALPWLFNDADEFPGKGYDYIIVNKILQLWKEEQDKSEAAMLYDQKATRSLARKHEDENRATEDTVVMQPNGHDEMLAHLRTNRPGRRYASLYPHGIT